MDSKSEFVLVIDLNELVEKESVGTLSNSDFFEMWSKIVLAPMGWYEYVIRSSYHTVNGYNSDQAVIYGLLVQIFKLIRTDRHLTCTRENNYELATVIQRMLFESNITVQYLIKNPDMIDTFRKQSVKGDKKFYDTIIRNRQNRGESDSDLYKWEGQILSSIKSSFDDAGYSPDDSIPRFPNMYDRMSDLKNESSYFVYAVNSGIIHNEWSYIAKYSLIKKDDKYFPDFDEYGEDIRLLNPILLLCYDTLKCFISSYSGHGIAHPSLELLEEEQKMIIQFDTMHQNYLHGRKLTTGL